MPARSSWHPHYWGRGHDPAVAAPCPATRPVAGCALPSPLNPTDWSLTGVSVPSSPLPALPSNIYMPVPVLLAGPGPALGTGGWKTPTWSQRLIGGAGQPVAEGHEPQGTGTTRPGALICVLSPPGAGFGTMRGCGARLVWLLVLSLVWLGPALGGEEEDGEGVVEEEEKEEVVSDELKEEDGVLVLHEHNFARALSEHRLLLVEFCKCPHRGQGCGQGRVWGVGVGREYGQGVQARGTGVGRSRRMRTGPGMGGEGVWARGKAAGQRVRATGHGL